MPTIYGARGSRSAGLLRPSFGLPRSAAGLPSVQIRGRWRDARIVGCAGEVRRIGRHRYIFRAGAVVRERCRTGEARLQRIGTEQRVRVVGALSGEPVTKLTWYVAPTGVGSLPSQKTGGGRHAGLGRVKDAEGAAKRGAGVPILSCAKQDRRAQTRSSARQNWGHRVSLSRRGPAWDDRKSGETASKGGGGSSETKRGG